MTTRTAFWTSFLCLCGLASPAGAADPPPRYADRWVYCMHNLLVDKSTGEVIALIKRASKSGYTGLVLADYKLSILDRMGPEYFRNIARVRAAAEAVNIELIPAVFPIGYSAGLLSHDANLAEGVPVKDAPFVVKGRRAELVPDPAARLRNGNLEEVRGDHFLGFSYQDDPGQTTFADHETVHGGKTSCRMEAPAGERARGNCRLIQAVKVRPHACCRFSAWLRTRDLKTADFRLLATGESGRSLSFYETRPTPTMDWTHVSVVFNSLGEKQVNLYAGMWGGWSGTLWLDDLKLEELALVNVLRREGCPFVVAGADGKTVYDEGKDYLPVRDPKLGQVPYAGEYKFDHAGPALELTDDSRIKDGERLRVSWYHPIVTLDFQVMCCLREEMVYTLLRDQARRVNDLLKPKTFLMSHDEIRVAGWCRACRESNLTPGELLADNVHRCVEIIKKVNPKARIVVWNDMFDPYHNAVTDYYLVNGTLEGSWKGLPRDVVIANWNGGKAKESLDFFAKRGHAQIIAGYYDAGTDNFKHWDAAARGVPNIQGFMYTTWQANYSDLEKYGELLRGKE